MTTHLIYFATAFAGLLSVAAVLVVIGRAAAACPQTAPAARLATWVVTTGFLAIGAGVVALIGAALPVLRASEGSGLYMALGFAFIALGIGFFVAATNLRDILEAARRAAAEARA